MGNYNPMTGFQIDPWSGTDVARPINVTGADPVMSFNYADTSGIAGSPVSSFGRPDFFSWDSFLGGKNKDGSAYSGWGAPAMGILQGLGSAYMGMKQYALARDQLQFSKDAFNKNFAAQAQTTNTALEDRQRARVASNPGAYQSVGDYMGQNRIAV